MKYLPATCILLLMTVHAAQSYTLLDIIFDTLIYYTGVVQRQVFYEDCPGVCVPVLFSFVCPRVKWDVSCPNKLYTSRCCTAIRLLTSDVETTSGNHTCISNDFIITQSADDKIDLSSIQNNEVIADKDVSTTSTNVPITVSTIESYDDKKNSQNGYSIEETSTKVNTMVTTVTKEKCKGVCVSGLMALLCDDVDSVAVCASGETCCVKSPSKIDSTAQTTTNNPQEITNAPINYNEESSTRSETTTSNVLVSDKDIVNTIDGGFEN